MLPLDRPSEELIGFIEKSSVNAELADVYLKLDLNAEGEFGEVWLFLSKDAVFYADPEKGKLKREMLEDISQITVDSLASLNRLVLTKGSENLLFALCTNSKKKKLFSFVEIAERFKKGETVSEDDPVFDGSQAFCPKCGKPYADRARKVCIDCLDKKSLFSRVAGYFTPYKAQLAVIVITALLTCLFTVISPFFAGTFLFDRVLSESEPDPFIKGNVLLGVGLILLCAVLSLLIQIIRSRANDVMSNKAVLAMKTDVFTSLQKLSLSFFNANQTGRLINSVDHDTLEIKNFFLSSVPSLVINVINFIGATLVMFFTNWKLALVVFIPVPLVYVLLKRGLPKLSMAYTMRWRRRRSMLGMLNDNIVGIRVVKAFAREKAESDRFNNLTEKYASAYLKVNLIQLFVFPMIGGLINVSGKAVWGFGGIMVMDKMMGYGEFLTFISLTTLIFTPLSFFATVADSFTNAVNAMQKVFGIMDTPPDIVERPDPITPEKTEGGISFNKVNFYYSPNRPILKDVSFDVSPGQSVGIVGRTGAGKSTLVNLILRLYDVKGGSIKIDGVDVRDLPLSYIRKNCAVVSQEVFIFASTVADNIRYARPGATDAEVMAAAKAANAHDFIMALPSGYETLIGGATRSLSGGEKQRISIARALLADPKILILDEATAAMDTETERQIQQALTELSKGKTTITIAHRLSTLKDCDILYVIENGRISERGTHDELLEAKGIFYKLCALQTDAMRKIIGG